MFRSGATVNPLEFDHGDAASRSTRPRCAAATVETIPDYHKRAAGTATRSGRRHSCGIAFPRPIAVGRLASRDGRDRMISAHVPVHRRDFAMADHQHASRNRRARPGPSPTSTAGSARSRSSASARTRPRAAGPSTTSSGSTTTRTGSTSWSTASWWRRPWDSRNPTSP